jgi:hypothetical protein
MSKKTGKRIGQEFGRLMVTASLGLRRRMSLNLQRMIDVPGWIANTSLTEFAYYRGSLQGVASIAHAASPGEPRLFLSCSNMLFACVDAWS